MSHLVFLKLGGSAITDKSRESTAREEVIRRAAREVALARVRNPDMQILLGHGSGSFGHYAARKWGFGSGEKEGWGAFERRRAYAETGAAANRLNRIVGDIFLDEGVPVVSLQPSASAHCREGELVGLEVATVYTALEQGLVPVVYGDVAFDLTRGMTIVSTEMIFAFLAPTFQPKRIIYAGAVKGIYSSDPSRNPDAELIPEITPESFQEIGQGVGEASGVDVTGGMLDKVRRNLALVAELPHLEVFVIGTEEGVIERALRAENFAEGTWIHAGALAGD